MPLYEYQCGRCGRFELIRKFSDTPVEGCPTCGSPVEKQLSSPAIQFKGAGWYVTDYAKKSSGEGSKSEGAKSDGAKSDGAKKESTAKTETTSTTSGTSGSGSGSGKSGSDS